MHKKQTLPRPANITGSFIHLSSTQKSLNARIFEQSGKRDTSLLIITVGLCRYIGNKHKYLIQREAEA